MSNVINVSCVRINMENFLLFILSVIRNDESMLVFWGILGLINMFVGDYYLRSKPILTEKELVVISPKFGGINEDYIFFSIFWVIFVFLLPLWALLPPISKWALINYGRIFYPGIVFITSGYAIYQALFAIIQGVYPRGRFLFYAYDDEKLVRQIGKRQIISSIVLFVVSVLFFFITSSRIQ